MGLNSQLRSNRQNIQPLRYGVEGVPLLGASCEGARKLLQPGWTRPEYKNDNPFFGPVAVLACTIRGRRSVVDLTVNARVSGLFHFRQT
jgi:hypothetical protein